MSTHESQTNVYVLDCETTGVDEPHLTQVCVMPIAMTTQGQIFMQCQPAIIEYYDPLKPISYGAMATTHITDEDVKGLRPHTEFTMPADAEYIVGHNVDYDIAVIENAGVDTEGYKKICTLALARYLVPDIDSHNLTALFYYFNKKFAKRQAKNAHSADIDVRITLLVLNHLIRVYNESALAGDKLRTIEDVYRLSETARRPTVFTFGKFKGKLISEVAETQEGINYFNWILKNKTDDKYLTEVITNLLNK